MNALPGFIKTYYEEGKYPEIIFFMRRMWQSKNGYLLKSNRNAVDRIKQEFSKLFGRRPYSDPATARYWDGKIAQYVSRLGVAALIKDMQEVSIKYGTIKSIVYFLHTKDAACRWEMLLMDKIEKELADEKKRITAEMEEMAQSLGIGAMMRDKRMDPTWVIEARKRLAFLSKRKTGPEEKREINRIVHNLKSRGYPLTQNEETRS